MLRLTDTPFSAQTSSRLLIRLSPDSSSCFCTRATAHDAAVSVGTNVCLSPCFQLLGGRRSSPAGVGALAELGTDDGQLCLVPQAAEEMRTLNAPSLSVGRDTVPPTSSGAGRRPGRHRASAPPSAVSGVPGSHTGEPMSPAGRRPGRKDDGKQAGDQTQLGSRGNRNSLPKTWLTRDCSNLLNPEHASNQECGLGQGFQWHRSHCRGPPAPDACLLLYLPIC